MKAKVLVLSVLLLWGVFLGIGAKETTGNISLSDRLHFLWTRTLLEVHIRWGVREDIARALYENRDLADHLVLLYLEYLRDNPRERRLFLSLLERFAFESPVRFHAALLCARRSQEEGYVNEAFSYTLEALGLAQTEEERLAVFQALFVLLQENGHPNEAVLLLRRMYLDFRNQTLQETRKALKPLIATLSPESFTPSSCLSLAEFFLSLGFLEDTERFIGSLQEGTLSPSLEQSLFLLRARFFLRKGNLESLEKLLEGRKESEDVLFYRGVLAQRKGVHRDAIRFFERLLSLYPESGYRLSTLQNIAFSYGMLKEENKQIETLQKATALFPKNGSLFWDLFWALYRKGDHMRAQVILKELERFPEWKNQALFWQFKISGDASFLATILEESHLDYYYVRAWKIARKQEEVALSPFVEEPEPELSLPDILKKHWAKYRFFRSLNLLKHAEIELLFLLAQNPRDPSLLLECSRFYTEMESHHKSLRFASRLLPERGKISKFAGQQYYPSAFLKDVKEFAEIQNPPLDPYLILALVHAESAFDSQAVSSAGALGLTQVLPSTGAWVIEKGWVNPGNTGQDITALLLAPRENLAIGIAYLAYLFRRFDKDPILALCGYNAGPGRAEQWKKELPRDRDVFIESIPFPETRNYVKKVLTNYFAYSMLYRGVSSFPDIF